MVGSFTESKVVPESFFPGVYVEEITFGSHPIEGVSTSTTGFIGRAAQGPLHEAVQVTGFGDFERTLRQSLRELAR